MRRESPGRAVWSSWGSFCKHEGPGLDQNFKPSLHEWFSEFDLRYIFKNPLTYFHFKKLKNNGKALEKNDYSCKSVVRLDTWCRSRSPTALSVASVSSPPACLSFPRVAPSRTGLVHARAPITDEAPHTSVTDEARSPGRIGTR